MLMFSAIAGNLSVSSAVISAGNISFYAKLNATFTASTVTSLFTFCNDYSIGSTQAALSKYFTSKSVLKIVISDTTAAVY